MRYSWLMVVGAVYAVTMLERYAVYGLRCGYELDFSYTFNENDAKNLNKLEISYTFSDFHYFS